MSKKLKFKVGKGQSKGCGFLSWDRLEERLKEVNELQPTDQLHTVEIDRDGIKYNTSTIPKKRKSK